ncbi:hypothetical protein TNCV_1691151 [Trichonephila clavipes]|nr:hypothetical protein TNCV_1691151 [Trichonephila clavipes]
MPSGYRSPTFYAHIWPTSCVSEATTTKRETVCVLSKVRKRNEGNRNQVWEPCYGDYGENSGHMAREASLHPISEIYMLNDSPLCGEFLMSPGFEIKLGRIPAACFGRLSGLRGFVPGKKRERKRWFICPVLHCTYMECDDLSGETQRFRSSFALFTPKASANSGTIRFRLDEEPFL